MYYKYIGKFTHFNFIVIGLMITAINVKGNALTSTKIHFHIGKQLHYPIQINRNQERVVYGKTNDR